ncbi:MAG TPA: hypothetical protein VD993_04530 [Chitinophagaceae bacterium]|nr:hypothetical protein [Chitinophagaceae bacterium]
MSTIMPIRTDLFRFVTLRTPQLLSQQKKELGFIWHPDPEKSHFLKNISDADTLQAARDIITRLTASFKPARTYQEIRAINPELYNFSSWLMKNRNQLNTDKLKQRIKSAGSLKEQQLISLWDNLMYQASTRQSPHVRQACIQMIIANNFAEVLRKGSLEELAGELIETPRLPASPQGDKQLQLFVKRLAKAKVVLPKAFSVPRATPATSDPVKPGTHDSLVLNQDKIIASNTLNTLQTVKSDLQTVQKAPVQNTARSSRTAPGITVNELKNNPRKVSANTESFIQSLPASDRKVDELTASLDREIKKVQRDSRPGRKKGRKTIISRGNVIRNRPSDVNAYTLSFRDNAFDAFADKKQPPSMYMSLGTGRKNAYVTNADLTLTSGGRTIQSNKVDIIDNKSDQLHMRLFPGKGADISNNDTFELKGNIQLDDGTNLTIDTKGSTSNKNTNGKAKTASPPVVTPVSLPSNSVTLYGVNNIGIGVLRKVEQEVCCYVPGEVSRIENILAREYKERHTRSLVSTETTEETTTETEVENMTDTATTDRNEMQTEVANVLNQDNSTSVGGSLGVSGKAFGVEVSAEGYIDTSSSTSASTSDSAAKTYAQEITERTVERVVQKTTQKRTSRMLQEYEENNRHGFDNRKGDKHVTGVYRWVDIVYTNRLINYGKRLMYEFMLPEPAYFYKQALEKIAEEATGAGSTTVLEEPIHPEENDITGPDKIDEITYLEYGRLYDITIAAPPKPASPVSDAFSPVTSPDGKDRTYDFDLIIPAGYEAVSAKVDFTFNYQYGDFQPDTQFVISVGQHTYSVGKADLEKKNGRNDYFGNYNIGSFSSPWINVLPVQVSCKNVFSFMVNVTATLAVPESTMNAWQNEAYDQIMRAYEDQLAAYNAEIEAAAEEAAKEAESVDTSHRSFNRTLEKREIQRLCIEMMTRPFDIRMGQNFYTDGNCVPSVDQTSTLENYASHVKFFEQAFDWENMSYLFYPYYWAGRCDWTELIQAEHAADPIFQAFLQCGMARVVVPVRPGFEDAVVYYMETGDIWNGGDLVLETDDDLYLSIAEEIMELEGFVEEEWQSRVPTALTIVQGDSVYLEDEGLPCCSHIENAETTTHLVGSTNVLTGLS